MVIGCGELLKDSTFYYVTEQEDGRLISVPFEDYWRSQGNDPADRFPARTHCGEERELDKRICRDCMLKKGYLW